MASGTTTARARTAAKAATKPIKEEPTAEEPAPAEEVESTTPPPGDLAQLVQDLQAAQDSDHDAIVGLSDELGSTNRALRSVIDQLAELAQFRKTSTPEGVETELGLERAIDAAMIRIMRDVREIGKDGQAPDKVGGYAYRKVDDIMNAVGGAMRDHAVFIRPEVVSNERRSWTSNSSLVTEVVLTMRYHWVSGVDGTSIDVLVVGEGRDNGDKATSKAQAMCYKTMLLQALCIPLEEVTGFDVEREDTSGMAPDRQQPTQYGYGHQPAQSPGGRAHQEAQQTPPPPDRQARQESPEELASRALTAARNANDLEGLEKVRKYAESLGILGVMVENAQLQTHLLAVRGMLGNPAEPHEVPVNDEPPWEQS